MRRFFLILALLLAPMVAGARFDRNLYYGLRNDADVVRLQDFLRQSGFSSYPVSTGNFFTITLQAVKNFQQARGISATGYFGPRSRESANSMLDMNTSPNISIPHTLKIALPVPTASPYKGKLSIGSAVAFNDKAADQSLTLSNSSDEDISLSGFSIENSNNEKFIIPKGYAIPGIYNAVESTIVLRPGDFVTVYAGRQNSTINFRTNMCVGYFSQSNTYSPPLFSSCPRPDVHNSLDQLTDNCIVVIESTPQCRQVYPGVFMDNKCSEYVNRHLNYVGCVNDNRTRPDFYGNEWKIWMQRDTAFLRTIHERIILKDPQGLVVAEYNF